MKQQVKNQTEAKSLASQNASAGYVGIDIELTLSDIEHLMFGGMIYQTCNQEYGVIIELNQEPKNTDRIPPVEMRPFIDRHTFKKED